MNNSLKKLFLGFSLLFSLSLAGCINNPNKPLDPVDNEDDPVEVGPGEGTLSVSSNMVKTQSNSKGLSKGNHTVVVSSVTTEYSNAYAYSGYTTVYASATATIN